MTQTIFTTNDLDNAELQAIDDSTHLEFTKLVECAEDAGTTDLGDTSCINEVFGDVHN
jgi:hypothetical protein